MSKELMRQNALQEVSSLLREGAGYLKQASAALRNNSPESPAELPATGEPVDFEAMKQAFLDQIAEADRQIAELDKTVQAEAGV